MQLETAVSLIEKGVVKNGNAQSWMDLGAGVGLFTTALASLLPSGSSILAVDKDTWALKSIKVSEGISLRILNQDFTSISFQEKYDGVLMANALHYVSDTLNFFEAPKVNLQSTYYY